MKNTTKCAVTGLTRRGYLLGQAMKRTRDYDEIMEKEILKNTDDTIRCFSVLKTRKIIGHEMVNVSKMFTISVTSIEKESDIQKQIQKQLEDAYASLDIN